MKLSDQLRTLADFPFYKTIEPILTAAADKLDDSHLWRDAWMQAENRADQLTKELEQVRSLQKFRKEKVRED